MDPADQMLEDFLAPTGNPSHDHGASTAAAAAAAAHVASTGALTPEQEREVDKALHLLKETGHTEQDANYAALVKMRAGSPASASAADPDEEQVPASNPVEPGSNITPQQILQLKAQMASLKRLDKNLHVTPALQAANEGAGTSAAAQASAAPKSAQDQKVAPAADGGSGTAVTASARAVQGKRYIVPSKYPTGLNPQEAIRGREENVRNRVLYRIRELESLPANLAPELKVKALIELKALRLLDYQRRLREEVATGAKRVTTLETSISPTAYKKVKKQSFKESRVAERLERQQQMDREQRENQTKQARRDYLNSVISQCYNFKDHHRTHALKITGKLSKLVANWHVFTEKEEAKKQERKAKERLRALKADDEEAYIKLIDKEKDTRISHLLQQTDQYLGELGAQVLEQKTHGEAMSDVGAEADSHGSKDFYHIAHSVTERVTRQSSLLVGGTLKDYQVKGLEWMISLYNNNLNGILADEMGLGKTIQTISLITYLLEHKKQGGPHLVIVPLSTLTNWQLEFEKWAPSVAKIVYIGSPATRKTLQHQIRSTQFNVLLTTYDFVMRDKAALSKVKFNYMIIDEGHRMKNAHCKLTQVLSQFYSSKHRLLLTGTPLQNNLPELWALLNFLLPLIFKSVKSFDEWFNAPFANTGEQLELNEEESLLVIRRLHKVLRPFMLRRLKKDVESELPDKVEKILKCQMSALQRKLYRQIKTQGAFLTQSSESAKQPATVGLSNIVVHLRKICNHPYVFREVEDQMNKQLNVNLNLVRAAGKFDLLDRMLPKLRESGHKVLIFFQMTEVMNIFEDYCRWREYIHLRLDGNTKADDRRIAMKDWNDPEKPYFVFLLSTRAGGLGLNLQTADTVIIFDSDWNPHQDLQAQDRAHRIGQTKEVRVYRLITVESIEEHILERAQYKLNVDSKVIQAGKFDQKSTAEERDMLLKALLEEDNQEHEEDDIFDDEELNQVLARDDDELELFRRMDVQIERKRAEEWRELGKKGNPTRLMDQSELPQIYLKTDEELAARAKPAEEVVNSKRQVKRIHEHLDEELSEAQWLKLVDEGRDVNEYLRKRKERREKRLKKAQAGQGQDGGGDDAESSSSSEDEGQATPQHQPEEDDDEDGPPRKKARRPAAAQGKGGSTTPSSAGAPGSPAGSASSPVAPTPRLDVKQALGEILALLIDARDREGRQRAELFLELPSPEDYPDYYEVITQPIALDLIQRRVDEDHYKDSHAGFVADLEQMFKNAKTYNEVGSFVYEDAVALQKLLAQQIKVMFPKPKAPRAQKKSKLAEEVGFADSERPTASPTAPSHSSAPEEAGDDGADYEDGDDDDDDDEGSRPRRGNGSAKKDKKRDPRGRKAKATPTRPRKDGGSVPSTATSSRPMSEAEAGDSMEE